MKRFSFIALLCSIFALSCERRISTMVAMWQNRLPLWRRQYRVARVSRQLWAATSRCSLSGAVATSSA